MTTTSLSAQWFNLDLADAYIVDRCYARTQRLMRDDAMVQMLSEQSILVLLSALYFDPSGLADKARLTIYGSDQVLDRVRHAITSSPLTLVSDTFIEHVAQLVTDAIFPEDAPGRSLD